jgi:hypothetical protein
MAILVLINICIIFFYRKYLQKEMNADMNQQVTSAVSQYVALSKIPELNKMTMETGSDSDITKSNAALNK